MNSKRGNMHILVTNDDGVMAPGLLALSKEMQKFGKVSILAPDRNWSASGHVRILDRPLRVKEVTLEDGSRAFASDGAPSDCVALAVCGYLGEKIDLVVSGINPVANVGHDVTYSGTVTAAMEAAIGGLPAIAFSLDAPDSHLSMLEYSSAALYASRIVHTFMHYGIARDTLLNVTSLFCLIEKSRESASPALGCGSTMINSTSGRIRAAAPTTGLSGIYRPEFRSLVQISELSRMDMSQ